MWEAEGLKSSAGSGRQRRGDSPGPVRLMQSTPLSVSPLALPRNFKAGAGREEEGKMHKAGISQKLSANGVCRMQAAMPYRRTLKCQHSVYFTVHSR